MGSGWKCVICGKYSDGYTGDICKECIPKAEQEANKK